MTTDPQDELLDIVDEANCVIGQATRGDIHKQHLRHRACHIIVFDHAGRVLVQQRSAGKDTGAGLWDSSAAGHVDSGESYPVCAVRELHEELGLRVEEDDLQVSLLLPAIAETGMEFAQVYRLKTDQQPQPDATEIAALRWCSKPELDAWVSAQPQEFTPVFHKIWQHLSGEH